MDPRQHHTRRSDRTPTDRPPPRRRHPRPPLEATVPTCHGPALPTGPTAPKTPTSGRHGRIALQHTLEHPAERGPGNVIRTKNGRLDRSSLLVTSRNRTARWPRTPARRRPRIRPTISGVRPSPTRALPAECTPGPSHNERKGTLRPGCRDVLPEPSFGTFTAESKRARATGPTRRWTVPECARIPACSIAPMCH